MALATITSLPKVEPLLDVEIASRGATEWYRSFDGEDPHPSKILQQKSGPSQRLGELYDEMLEKDADLSGLWEKRWKAVLGLPRFIVASDSSPLARDIAEFCHQKLRRIPSLHLNLSHQLQAITHGIAIDEVIWTRDDDGDVVPADIVDRPMHRFLFRSGELYVRQAGGEAVAANPANFLVSRNGTKDNPWGVPLLDKIWRFWWLKKFGWKYFAVFLEKWAQPTAVGKYPRSRGKNADTEDDANQQALLDAASRIQTDYAVAIPEDLAIDLLEAQRSGSANYEHFIMLANRAMALFFLGEVDTSGLAKGPGSFAKNRVSNEVRLETIRIDSHALTSHLTDHLLRPMVVLNFGATAPVPRFHIVADEAEDRQLRQAGIQAVLDLGQPVPSRHVYQTYQVPEPQEGDEVIAKPPGTVQGAAA